MHELALTESIVATVRSRLAGRPAAVLRLRIGRLSGVVPDAVRFCFEACAQGTELEGAALEIEEVPGRAACHTCRSEVDLSDGFPLCPCGSADVAILAGDELRILEVELR